MMTHGGRPGPIEYWRPGEAVRDYVTGYHRYSAAAPPGVIIRDAFFPSWATIRVALPGSSPWSLRMGSRTVDPVTPCAFVGPSSYAGYVATRGGTLVGMGVLPLGWAALFGGDVSRFANRVVPLAQIDPGASLLADALAESETPATVFEQWVAARLALRPPPDPRIAQLFALIDDPATTRTEQIAEALGLSSRALAAVTRTSFGFTPKLLLRRGRFLRALSDVLSFPEEASQRLEQLGYWDRSHFLRDSHLFLGCSIREFNKRRSPLNQTALRVRAEVMGAAV